MTTQNILGHRHSVPDSPVTLWPGTPGNYVFAEAPEILEVFSDSLEDGPGGIGARVVKIDGLDHALDEISSGGLVSDGLVRIDTTVPFFRVNRAVVVAVGEYGGKNVGTISVVGKDSGIVFAVIPPGTCLSQQGVYTVPKTHRATLVAFSSHIAGQPTHLDLKVRPLAEEVSGPLFGPVISLGAFPGLSGNFTRPFPDGVEFRGGSDVWLEAEADLPPGSDVAATFSVRLTTSPE